MNPLEIVRRTNKRVMIASFILILLAISGYVMEYIRGTRTLDYIVLMSASLLAPILFTFVFYNLKQFIESFKTIALYSFILSWMIMLTFSPKVIQFTLIFPLIVIYVLYFDFKLIRNASLLILVFGIFKVVLNIRYYGMTDSFMMTEYTVFILSLIAFGLITINTISFSLKIRNQQLESIIEEKEKNASLLEEMKNVVSVIQKTTNEVYPIYHELLETSDVAAESITQLSEGVTEISGSISSQCDRSTTMQEMLKQNSSKSLGVVDKTNRSADKVHEGNASFSELDAYSDKIRINNHDVYEKMKDLEKNAMEIKGIVDIMQKIATQTNLLALNASIESARAGEAGKGFTVVSEAIRDLSQRTTQSLEGVNLLIERLEDSASMTLATVKESLEFGESIQELIHTSKALFDEIDGIITEVNAEISETVRTTETVVNNNQKVVDEISKLSISVKESATAADRVSEKVAYNKTLTMKAKSYMDELAQIIRKL